MFFIVHYFFYIKLLFKNFLLLTFNLFHVKKTDICRGFSSNFLSYKPCPDNYEHNKKNPNQSSCSEVMNTYKIIKTNLQ